jgi:hypothetical protein
MNTRSDAATKNSWLAGPATDRISGRSTSQPNATRASRPPIAGAKASSIVGENDPPRLAANTASVTRSGPTVRS